MQIVYRQWIRITATRPRDDRGDVPGWVMITLMTAALVAGILAIARPGLQSMLETALNRVSGSA